MGRKIIDKAIECIMLSIYEPKGNSTFYKCYNGIENLPMSTNERSVF
jgi:hypothetical protein